MNKKDDKMLNSYGNNCEIFLKNKCDDTVVKTVFKNENYDLPLLQFREFTKIDWINHCFTTKLGGVSSGIFESLNLSFTRGDDRDCVLENFRRVGQFFDKGIDSFVLSHQTHTTNVCKVTKKDKGNGITRELPYQDVDGFITNEKGIILSTFYADCVPLYFVDIVNKAIGLSHSGWKGTVSRMGRETINAMQKEFGTKTSDLMVAIGPSICKDCYEVSKDVRDEFVKEFSEYENEILTDGIENHYYLDLWKANEIVMLEEGVSPENIFVSKVCTSCNSDILFSHRKTNGKRGNLGAFLMLK